MLCYNIQYGRTVAEAPAWREPTPVPTPREREQIRRDCIRLELLRHKLAREPAEPRCRTRPARQAFDDGGNEPSAYGGDRVGMWRSGLKGDCARPATVENGKSHASAGASRAETGIVSRSEMRILRYSGLARRLIVRPKLRQVQHRKARVMVGTRSKMAPQRR